MGSQAFSILARLGKIHDDFAIASSQGEIPGPRIRSTGEFLVPKGGSARDLVFDIRGAMHISTPELSEPNEGAAAAKELIDAGVDGIKLYVSTGFPPILVLSDGVIHAAVNVAHGQGKPVFAHPSTREGLLAALRGGADVLVHTTPQAGDWDESGHRRDEKDKGGAHTHLAFMGVRVAARSQSGACSFCRDSYCTTRKMESGRRYRAVWNRRWLPQSL